jgi:predicted DNA-binding protein
LKSTEINLVPETEKKLKNLSAQTGRGGESQPRTALRLVMAA